MNNLYHKVAVTCIYTALSFTLVINNEAKAATLSATRSEEFFIEYNYNSQYSLRFTGPKPGPSGHSFLVQKLRYSEQRAFFEFSLSNLSLIKSAIFSIRGEDLNPGRSIYVEILGYTGNRIADPLDFYTAQESLGTLFFTHPNRAGLDVTRFVNERVSNRDPFVRLGISIPAYWAGSTYLSRTYYGPQLIVETADVAEPVPEPTTIFGSALALGVGGWLKRKKSSQQNKTTSQN